MELQATSNPVGNLNQVVEFTPEEKNKIEQYKQAVDLTNVSGVIQFGLSSQNNISQFSSEILKQVRTKDLGEAQNVLIDLRANVKSFDESLNSKGIFSFFNSIKNQLKRIRAKYTSIEGNINAIELRLEQHYNVLLKDINIFDRLYVENHKYFKELSLYIAAGEEKLKEMKEVVLPQLKVDAEKSGDQLKAQEFKDMEQNVERFERRIHDLKLTRVITLQNAPQIKLIQGNSTSLMEKLQSSIVNTLPLWKNQMVLTLGIAHSQQAMEAQKAVTDATNELLLKNSELLKDSTVKITTETQRSIVDIETLKKVNTDILSTIDEVLRIQKDGREKRQLAEASLQTIESELRNKILKPQN